VHVCGPLAGDAAFRVPEVQQAARLHEGFQEGDGWELVLDRELRDLWEVARNPLVVLHQEGLGAPAGCSRKGAGDVAGASDFEPLNLNAQQAGRITHGLKWAC